MDASKRRFMTLIGATAVSLPLMANALRDPMAPNATQFIDSPQDMAKHEHFMQMAVDEALKNRRYPFGAVIVRHATGEVLARGVNTTIENSMFHGEIVAMNHLVARHGNDIWNQLALYTTGEPCAMCMGAMAWAGLPHVVWASSMATISASGIDQIDISARQIAALASSFYQPRLLAGGILATKTDLLFFSRLDSTSG